MLLIFLSFSFLRFPDSTKLFLTCQPLEKDFSDFKGVGFVAHVQLYQHGVGGRSVVFRKGDDLFHRHAVVDEGEGINLVAINRVVGDEASHGFFLFCCVSILDYRQSVVNPLKDFFWIFFRLVFPSQLCHHYTKRFRFVNTVQMFF